MLKKLKSFLQKPTKINHKAYLGKLGEDTAAKFLKKNGYKILHQNWRHKSYEIDIIATKDEELIFVEVRTKTKDTMTTPAQSITTKKQNILLKAATIYLTNFDCWHLACRFDFISVVIENNSINSVEHTKDAFNFTMDSCNTSWQP